MTLPVDVRRPPKPNYFITVAGSRIGVERRDLSARDVLQARIDFTIALTYARFYIRSMHPVAIKDVFTDDDGNDWRVRGVSRYGRGWNEVIAQTTSLDPTPAPPMPPLPPGEPDYRFDTEGSATGGVSDGNWRYGDFFIGGSFRQALDLGDDDADGVTVVQPSVDDTVVLAWDEYSVTITLVIVDYWRGFGGQTRGPRWAFDDEIDTDLVTGELLITIGE